MPKDLAPRGGLNWNLPSKAVKNNEKILKLAIETDEFLEGFHQRISEMDTHATEWVEMRGASPTKTGEAQLQERSSYPKEGRDLTACHDWVGGSDGRDDYVFNVVRSPTSPKNADIFYLTDGTHHSEDDEAKGGEANLDILPSNLRVTEWPTLENTFVEASEPEDPNLHLGEGPDIGGIGVGTAMDLLPNVRVTEWPSDERVPNFLYTAEPHDTGRDSHRSLGPYDRFWQNHDIYGHEQRNGQRNVANGGSAKTSNSAHPER